MERARAFNGKMKSLSHDLVCRLKLHPDFACVLLTVVFPSLLFFVNFGGGPLWAADEQTYSQWAFYMAKTGDYLNPWAFGAPSLWVGKPPLYIWLMALSYQIFGVSNFSTRFWSPIFGVLCCVVLFFLGKKLYSRAVGLLSVAVLSTFFGFFAFARHAMLDVPFIFFMLASIFFLVLSLESEKGIDFAILAGLSFGLALMTKLTIALLIPIIMSLYLVLSQKSVRGLLSRRFAIILGVGVVVTVPWLIYMIIQFGQEFWNVFVFYHSVERAFVPLEGHAGDVFFYFNYLLTRENLVWVAILPFGFSLSVYRFVRKRSKADAMLVIWIIVVMGLFTLAQTKLYWYILPAFPAFALTVAVFLISLFQKLKARPKNPEFKRY